MLNRTVYIINCFILQGVVLPLWRASYEGRVEVVETLLDRGAEVNKTNHVRGYSCTLV